DCRRRAARLLDHDREGSHLRPFGGPDGGLGAFAGDCQRVWRTANLRVTSFDHVLPQDVLFLCPAKEESSGSLVFSRTNAQGAYSAEDTAIIEGQSRSPGSCHASGSG